MLGFFNYQLCLSSVAPKCSPESWSPWFLPVLTPVKEQPLLSRDLSPSGRRENRETPGIRFEVPWMFPTANPQGQHSQLCLLITEHSPSQPLMQFQFCSHHPDNKRTPWKSGKKHQEHLLPLALRVSAPSLCLRSSFFLKINCKIQEKARECPASVNSAQITKNWSSVKLSGHLTPSLSLQSQQWPSWLFWRLFHGKDIDYWWKSNIKNSQLTENWRQGSAQRAQTQRSLCTIKHHAEKARWLIHTPSELLKISLKASSKTVLEDITGNQKEKNLLWPSIFVRIILDFYLLVFKKMKGRILTNHFTKLKISFRILHLKNHCQLLDANWYLREEFNADFFCFVSFLLNETWWSCLIMSQYFEEREKSLATPRKSFPDNIINSSIK